MALADPGCVLSVDKLVAAAAHQLRGPQVHVLADPGGGAGAIGSAGPSGRHSRWRAPSLGFPSISSNRVSPGLAPGIRRVAPGEGPISPSRFPTAGAGESGCGSARASGGTAPVPRAPPLTPSLPSPSAALPPPAARVPSLALRGVRPAPVPALTGEDGERQAEPEDDRVAVQRQLSQRGRGQRVAEGHEAQGAGPEAARHVDDLRAAGALGGGAGAGRGWGARLPLSPAGRPPCTPRP